MSLASSQPLQGILQETGRMGREWRLIGAFGRGSCK